jgi:hypothetical protein
MQLRGNTRLKEEIAVSQEAGIESYSPRGDMACSQPKD